MKFSILAVSLLMSVSASPAMASTSYAAKAEIVFKKAVESGQLNENFRQAESLGLKRTQNVHSIRMGSSDIFGVHVERYLVLLDLVKEGDRIGLGAIVEVSSDGDDKVITPVDLKKIEALLLSPTT